MIRGYNGNGINEDLDEYEHDFIDEDEEGNEYEETKEEERKLTNEELKYLEYRQRLKEKIRKNLKKETGASVGIYQEKKKNKLPYDGNYGNFFGPSQPVIHERVLQEHKSSLENHQLTARVSNPLRSDKKIPASTTVGITSVVRDRPPKPVDEVKLKVQKLKDNRDYSSLFSEDAEFPAPTIKEPPYRNVSVPKSGELFWSMVSADVEDARSAQVSHTSKKSISDSRRSVSKDRNDRRPISTNRQMQNNPVHKVASSNRPIVTSADFRKQHGSNAGNGPSRPVDPKRLPSKLPILDKLSAVVMDKKTSVVGVKRSSMGVHKAPLSKLNSSVYKQQAKRNGDVRGPVRAKQMSKEPNSMSRPQMKPSTQISSRAPAQVDRLKKRPARQFSDEEDEDAFSMLRKMTRYNPNKFSGRDDDDSDMEAGFEDILLEERHSARIAREEDERELRLIEEEERRQNLRKAKRLKQQ
ncbi:hypothetical protein GIB67_029388 [Kingdonia uniflora]|uniref:Protein SPT2 homolog n=1 Tax=Kingdonia uniflora TaxID=39325 RepID=A0A7J7NY01_9MAGN|nr:hypothetical protein GIB67_029388 [Kingdonia uniflora]